MTSIRTEHFTWNFIENSKGEIRACIQVSELLYQLNTKKDLRNVRKALAGKALEAFDYEFEFLQKSFSGQV